MRITKPYYCAVILAVLYLLFVGFEILHSNGYVGVTKKTTGLGCICHGPHQPTDSVFVWIAGPDSLHLGEAGMYTLYMTGGPAVAGGFDLAAGRGILSTADTATQLMNDELTHLVPKNFQNDTVRWQFLYHAPVNGEVDTLFSVGNSVDLLGTPAGDEYNFGNDFIVRLIDTTLDVRESGNGEPLSFRLEQNYPNPFNPATHLQFTISKFQMITLKIYDVLGREVATLVNERKSPGTYTVSWDARGCSSGVYIYRIDAGIVHQAKTMLLLR